ncbi:hypothetical protein COOONC_11198 [Cooperia oncophora]
MKRSLIGQEPTSWLAMAPLLRDQRESRFSPIRTYLNLGAGRVNEEGTEAAAVTGMRMKRRLALIKVPHFLADRPFIYGIFRENEPIFIGQYC